MSAALEHPVVPAVEHPIGPHTVAEWLAADHPSDGSRLELIWGYYHVSPAPTGQHQYACGRLRTILENAVDHSDRRDLYAVDGVAVEVAAGTRTGLIPDVVLLDTRPVGVSFVPEHVQLVVEIWSPDNSRGERETKIAAYAAAGVPFLWTVVIDRLGALTLTTHDLHDGEYRPEITAHSGETVTVKAAPVPVTLDPGELCP
ncbi:MAG TPA: Uma2 family endonuclease [Pseudonocardiaceae bacterium]|jgi:Uma2 family endonuclease|nr:Uma2 family endonuclease [Pseudonocardiaceae bacterium]